MMKLHLNKENFKDLITIASGDSGIAADIIEKDYYVTLILEELASMQEKVKAFFKGGTCLYKIYAPMQRFSEDIDLTVFVKELSKSQAKKMLELSSKKYSGLERDDQDLDNENRKGSITQVYHYDSVFSVKEEPLQRFERVKVESTSFTVSEPTERNDIRTLLSDMLSEENRTALEEEYGMKPFRIENISLERIFCDKLLAAEFYYERKAYFDVAKHMYDIHTMLKMDRIKRLLISPDMLVHILSYKRIEETLRIGSDLYDKPFKDFLLFEAAENNPMVKKSFENMQERYVFQEKFKKDYEDVQNVMFALQGILERIDEKEQEQLHSQEFLEKVREYNAVYEFEKSDVEKGGSQSQKARRHHGR